MSMTLSKTETRILVDAAVRGVLQFPESMKPITRQRMLGRLEADGLIEVGEPGGRSPGSPRPDTGPSVFPCRDRGGRWPSLLTMRKTTRRCRRAKRLRPLMTPLFLGPERSVRSWPRCWGGRTARAWTS